MELGRLASDQLQLVEDPLTRAASEHTIVRLDDRQRRRHVTGHSDSSVGLESQFGEKSSAGRSRAMANIRASTTTLESVVSAKVDDVPTGRLSRPTSATFLTSSTLASIEAKLLALKREQRVATLILLLTVMTVIMSLAVLLWSQRLSVTHMEAPYLADEASPDLSYGPLDELDALEFDRMLQYLKPKLNLVLEHEHHENATYLEMFATNHIWSVVLKTPKKTQLQRFFTQQRQGNFERLARFAQVTVIMGADRQNLHVADYQVGPLDKPTSHKLLRKVDFLKRPLSSLELRAVNDLLAIKCSILAQLIEDVYQAGFFMPRPSKRWASHNFVSLPSHNMCTSKAEVRQRARHSDLLGDPACLKVMYSSPLITHGSERERRLWVRLNRDVSPFNQYPTDLQFCINMTNIDPDSWEVASVWFQGESFDSVELLLHSYNRELKVVKRPFVDLYPDQFKKDVLPNTSTRRQDRRNNYVHQITSSPRINRRRIQHGAWDLYVTVKHDTGLRIHEVMFAGVRYLAEAGLDETVTAYWGESPFIQKMTSLESQFGVGRMLSELSPGVDCPASAIYLPVRMIQSDVLAFSEVKHGICVFEWVGAPSGGPSRRHFEFYPDETGHPAGFGSGAVDRSLVIRSVSSLFNYDYLFDVILHTSGSMEFSVTPTGYIHMDLLRSEQRWRSNFGIPSSKEPLYFTLHTHLFLLKLDVDVHGPINHFKTLAVKGNETNPMYLEEKVFAVEKEARLLYSFDQPKQLLACQGKFQSETNGRCLLIGNRNYIKNVYPDSQSRAFPWVQHQFSVTKWRENETSASSIYNGVDITDPVVDFNRFSENNESIDGADLVIWTTVGNYHLPRQEDLPNTETAGRTMGIQLMPHNLFTSNPDATACDRIYTTNISVWLTGLQSMARCDAHLVDLL